MKQLYKKNLLIILCLFYFAFASKITKAQTYDVGNTSVTAHVGQLGNATAAVPIYCPAGRLGIKPNVSLTFNSQANSGILGKGWNFTGLSVISRSGNNWHLDDGIQETVKFDNNDKLTFDGQRLLKVEGGAASSYLSDNNAYRTEVDQFAKITYKHNGGNSYFIVDTKDGGKSFYGQTNNSQHKPNSSSNILSWYISKSYDRNGNYMEYFYTNSGGQIILDEIKYTGYDATINGTKTSSISQEAPFNKIVFEYETTSYEGNQYINGEKIVQNKRVKTIKTYADATLARTYTLDYDTDDINSYLKKITEQNGVGGTLHPIDINWTIDGGNITRNTFSARWDEYKTRFTGDFNGDGKADLLLVKGELYPWNGSLLTNPEYIIVSGSIPYSSGTIQGTNISAIAIGDLNSDGSDDILIQTKEMITTGPNQADNDWPCSDYNRFTLLRNIYHYKLLDLNKTTLNLRYPANEFIKSFYNNGANVGVELNNPNSSEYYVSFDHLNKLVNVLPILNDIDGDGQLDLILKEMWGKRTYEKNICDDIDQTDVDLNAGFLINTIVYPSSLNLNLPAFSNTSVNGGSPYVENKVIINNNGSRIKTIYPWTSTAMVK